MEIGSKDPVTADSVGKQKAQWSPQKPPRGSGDWLFIFVVGCAAFRWPRRAVAVTMAVE